MIFTEEDVKEAIGNSVLTLDEAVLRCLEQRVFLNEWEATAFSNGWEPPDGQWYDEEREQIVALIWKLVDRNKIAVRAKDLKLKLCGAK